MDLQLSMFQVFLQSVKQFIREIVTSIHTPSQASVFIILVGLHVISIFYQLVINRVNFIYFLSSLFTRISDY